MKKSNFLFFLFFSSISLLDAQEHYLSTIKENILQYSYNKAKQDSNKLEKDWINPITYRYIYSNTEEYDTHRSNISISQPIFKSGGIYYAIKYAKSVNKQTKIGIDIQKKELIKQTITLLFQIKKIDITILKQKILIQNAKIDIERKKEQVLNGILDTSFLDKAILDANSKQNALIDLEYQRSVYINNLSTFSDKKYEELELPALWLTQNKLYLEKNIYIQKSKREIETSYLFKNMIRANYLATINLTADYTKYHDKDNNPILLDENTNYGFNITIPLDIKYSNTTQSAKIEYLQKKALLQDKKEEENVLYKNIYSKIQSLDKKINIAQNDIILYDSLVTQIKEQLEVGMKTKSDLETIQNSQKIKKLEIQSLKVDKQIELLQIYSRVTL
ncbi:MAG: hypothetical protein CSA86_04835 [Arcobacter sp.]|nr:MAG: hypothetical protein CSA86_04835 [Arcobacter sp.]